MLLIAERIDPTVRMAAGESGENPRLERCTKVALIRTAKTDMPAVRSELLSRLAGNAPSRSKIELSSLRGVPSTTMATRFNPPISMLTVPEAAVLLPLVAELRATNIVPFDNLPAES